MAARTSTSFIMTADVNDSEDMELLMAIRERVKEYNKTASKKKRVVIRGRKPVEKEFVTNYWTGKSGHRSYDWAGNIVGGIKNATFLDVYIYNRS